MSSQTFPSFAGLKISVRRTPEYGTKIQRTASGKELRLSVWSTPIQHYEVSLEFLRTAYNGNEVNTLLTFLETMKGSWDTFYFNDPISGSQVTVRFEADDPIQLEMFATGYWKVDNIRLVGVK